MSLLKLKKEFRKTVYNIWNSIDNKVVIPDKSVCLDVIIPVVPKDLHILPLCLQGVRRQIPHKIDAIYVVAPDNEDIKLFCRKESLVFVEESSVLGYAPRKSEIKLNDGSDLSGWVFQQLLKLSARIGNQRYFLTIDADHVLLQPHPFLTTEGRVVYYRSREYNEPYYKNIEQLMGHYPVHLFSYVSHKMLFDKNLLHDLQHKIEQKKIESWDKAIIHSIDPKVHSGFSEFELYGDFVCHTDCYNLPWRSKSLPYTQIDKYDNLVLQYGQKYRSVTFPEYFQNKTSL